MSRMIATARKQMLSAQFIGFARDLDEKLRLFRPVVFCDANLAKVGVDGRIPSPAPDFISKIK
jgi:hypothetical protein